MRVSSPDKNGWRDIASAPKTGRPILVAVEYEDGGRQIHVVKWSKRKYVMRGPHGAFRWYPAYDGIGSVLATDCVIRWQPLPKFPEAA